MARTLIDTRQAAEMLGARPHTLENWRYLGTGPRYFKVGGFIKYSVQDLEAWLDSQAVGGDRPAAGDAA